MQIEPDRRPILEAVLETLRHAHRIAITPDERTIASILDFDPEAALGPGILLACASFNRDDERSVMAAGCDHRPSTWLHLARGDTLEGDWSDDAAGLAAFLERRIGATLAREA